MSSKWIDTTKANWQPGEDEEKDEHTKKIFCAISPKYNKRYMEWKKNWSSLLLLFVIVIHRIVLTVYDVHGIPKNFHMIFCVLTFSHQKRDREEKTNRVWNGHICSIFACLVCVCVCMYVIKLQYRKIDFEFNWIVRCALSETNRQQ